MARLVPLRIPSGWTVAFNRFEEAGPPSAMSAEERDAHLTADLLSLERGELAVDLGWAPAGDPGGAYALRVVRGSWDDIAVRFDHPSADVMREAIDVVLDAAGRDADLAAAQTLLDELR
jgi:hypothetical protein